MTASVRRLTHELHDSVKPLGRIAGGRCIGIDVRGGSPLTCVRRDLQPRVQRELFHDVAYVTLDGVGSNIEPRGNFLLADAKTYPILRGK